LDFKNYRLPVPSKFKQLAPIQKQAISIFSDHRDSVELSNDPKFKIKPSIE
jgi:hypothetical protein